jgi:hypothetical protein
MDTHLAELIDSDTPKLNPDIARGLAVKHMAHCERYIDEVWRSAAKGFPVGFEYKGCKRCTPQEEFNIATEKKGSRRSFDVAKSDVYLMKYLFSFNGVDLPARAMYLPFVSDAGYMHIGGSRFNISPLLSDRVISVPNSSSVFVRLLRDRLTFKRMSQHVMFNDRLETVQVPWSTIYHKNDKMKKAGSAVKAESTIIHYLFCKYGFTNTFKMFANCEPIIGGAEITDAAYPSDEWVICTSTTNMHQTYRRTLAMKSDIRIAIKKECLTPMVKSMVAGFFYVATIFPQYVVPEHVEHTRMWITVMGHVIFSGSQHDGKLHDDVAEHMRSLDEYLDELVIQKLKDIGIFVTDIYQLFALIIDKFNEWIIDAVDKVASMYDKEISILYYVLYEITSSIFNFCYRLKAAAKKELTAKDIVTIMNKNIKTGKIFSLTKGHGEISNLSTSGDNMAFKVTAVLVPQGSSNRKTRKQDASSLNDPSRRLHTSIAEVGAYSNIPKSRPDGRARINQCLKLNDQNVVVPNPAFADMLAKVEQLIKR